MADAVDKTQEVFGRYTQEEETRDFDRALTILSEHTEDTECWFDHHGGCQAHCYLDLSPGQICGNLEAKQLLSKYGYWNTQG